jgi:hypothetical protein
MYVVSVGSVAMMGIVRLLAMVAVFAVVVSRRHPSIVMVMDVRAISSTVAMVNRTHGSERKLLLSTAIARREITRLSSRDYTVTCPCQIRSVSALRI